MKRNNKNINKELKKNFTTLEQLENKKKEMLKKLKTKVKRKFPEKSLLPKKATKYDKLNTKKIKELLKNKVALKIKTLKNKDILEERKNCTHKPKINKNTESLLNKNRLPVHERELLKKKFDFHSNKKEKNPQNKKKINLKKIKPIEEKIYQRKMDWRKNIDDKLETIRDYYENEEKSMVSTTFRSGSNFAFTKKINEKVKSKNGKGFLLRVGDDLKERSDKKKKLDEKYNSFTFKPVINEKMNFKSVVKKKFIK